MIKPFKERFQYEGWETFYEMITIDTGIEIDDDLYRQIRDGYVKTTNEHEKTVEDILDSDVRVNVMYDIWYMDDDETTPLITVFVLK